MSKQGETMTPQEISAINRKLAEWAGRSSKFMSVNGITYDQHCEPYPKDYYNTNASQDLLGVLVEKGCTYSLQDDQHNGGHALVVWNKRTSEMVADSEYVPEIPAAICHACLEVAEREGKE